MNNDKRKNDYNKEEEESIEKKSKFLFTEAEYLEIANKIFAGGDDGYEMLFERAEKNLKNYINWKCYCIGWPDFGEDAMQIFKLKLYTSVVSGYLNRDGNGLNPDYKGFSAWMKTVADNVIYDILRVQKAFYSMLNNPDDFDGDGESRMMEGLIDPDGGPEDIVIKQMIIIELLKRCVDSVINLDNSIYKIIAWLGHRVLLYRQGVSNSKTNVLLTEQAEQRTLFDMYDIILSESESIKWLCITPAHREKIEKELSKVVDGKVMGDRLFSEFYMAKGPVATISDWRNRIDEALKKKYLSEFESI